VPAIASHILKGGFILKGGWLHDLRNRFQRPGKTNIDSGRPPVSNNKPAGLSESSAPRRYLHAGWLSDVGCAREQNEDALFVLTGDIEQGERRQSFGLFVIADGMGGHEQGENASYLAARTVADELMRNMLSPVVRSIADRVPLHQAVRDAVMLAHQKLQHELPGAGTTLTVALIVDDLLAIGHVGDSRAYLVHDGQVEQVTQDHSFVARLVELGQSTAEEAAVDPRRNYLLRALGQTDVLEVDFQFEAFTAGCKLLLCTDGLWGQIPHAELENRLKDATDPAALCRALIDAANGAGGPDNITAICVIRA
jgi:serine/threonine protein phosphatase PrpC